jgi:hypothetical protein
LGRRAGLCRETEAGFVGGSLRFFVWSYLGERSPNGKKRDFFALVIAREMAFRRKIAWNLNFC